MFVTLSWYVVHFTQKTRQKKNSNDIPDEIHCWLRFISSNTKRSLNFPSQVLVVLTNGDKGFQNEKPLVETCLTHLKQKLLLLLIYCQFVI
jgi:hypothetical protein